MKIQLIIPGRLPSWNTLLAMGHWQRAKFKTELQREFLSALQACGSDSSTQTTFARSTTSIAAATLASYLETTRAKSLSKRRNAKQQKAKKNTSSSKWRGLTVVK